tara:strand:- start:1554 stop:4004 length:2451 start_codon:yes stop_codon:yes gene_type:complete
MRGRYLILVVFIVLFSQFCFSIENDFQITIVLDDEIYTGLEYDKLFKIKNLDWTQDRIESDIIVNYYFLDDDELLLDEDENPVLDEYILFEGLRSSKSSKTGYLNLEESGDYYFCAEIIETSIDENEDDLENNFDCKEITVIDIDDVDIYNDFEVEISLEDIIFSEMEYYDLFKIVNNDWNDFKMETDITINYYIFDEDNNILFEDNTFIEGLKASKASNTGEIYIEDEGIYTFCAEIIDSSIEDDNEENNLDCKEINVINSLGIPCNMTIEIDSKDYFSSDETSFRFDFVIDGEDFYPEVEFWVEDIFGYIVQEKWEYEIDDNYYGKLYKSNIGDVYDYQNFIIKANITDPWCDDSDYDDNLIEKLVVVQNPNYFTFDEYDIEPYVLIDTGKSGTINFGSTFYVDIEAWAGDMSGKLKIWVEENSTRKKISESVVSIGMPKMTFISDLKVPVELIENCDRKYADDNYTIVVEGFGFRDENLIDIGGVNNKICRDDNSAKESSFSIERVYYKSGENAKFGESVRAKVKVYKGDTGKSSVKAYVKDNTGKKISSYDSRFLLKTKYQTYDLTIPVQLKPLCDGSVDDRTFYFVVEGLDTKSEFEILIDGHDTTLCKYGKDGVKTSSNKGSFYSNIAYVPRKIKSGELFYVEVDLENKKTEDIEVSLWSYVGKGRKVFGEKESNKKTVVVGEGNNLKVQLVNSVEVDPGEYELKVVVDRSDIKTNKNLKQNILIESSEKNNTCVVYESYEVEGNVAEVVFTEPIVDTYSYKYDKDIESVKPISGAVIYESSTVKASKFVPYMIIGMLFCLCIVLVVWKV